MMMLVVSSIIATLASIASYRITIVMKCRFNTPDRREVPIPRRFYFYGAIPTSAPYGQVSYG